MTSEQMKTHLAIAAICVLAVGLVVQGVHAEGSGQPTVTPAPTPTPVAVTQDRDDHRDRDNRGGWDMPPQEFREAQRQGFRDGVEGARHDFDNHRRPNVNNRDEYRHPHIEASLRGDYREGYRRGYDAGVEHLFGGPR